MTTEALFDAAERGWKAGEAKQWSRPFFEWPGLWGEEEACFVLPLRLCKPMNQLARSGMAGQAWAMGAHKRKVRDAMRLQHKPRREPLAGRPQVICVRFSIVEPDKYANWGKVPVDRLLPPRMRAGKLIEGLNYITDDSPKCIDLHECWWPVSKRADEVVVIKVYSGQGEAE